MPTPKSTTKLLEKLECNQEELLKTLNEVHVDVQKLEDEYKNVSIRLTELRDKVNVQNGRIAKLENLKWFIMGAVAILAGIASYVFAHVFKLT